MNWQELVGLNWTTLVNWLTNHIDNSSEGLWADWHENWSASVFHLLATDETFSGVQSNGSDVVATQVLGDLKNETVLGTFDLKRIENGREFTLELDVNDGTDDLGNLSSGGAKASCCTET